MKEMSLLIAANAGRRFANVLRIANNISEGDSFTIGGEVYRFKIVGDERFNAGEIPVDVTVGAVVNGDSGTASPAVATPAIVLAINANTRLGVVASRISDNEILLATRRGVPPRQLACTANLVGVNNGWSAPLMYGGSGQFPGVEVQSRAAGATSVALGAARFVFRFNPSAAIVQVRTAAGLPKAWGGQTVITGERVDLVNNGTVDFIAGDILMVIAGE